MMMAAMKGATILNREDKSAEKPRAGAKKAPKSGHKVCSSLVNLTSCEWPSGYGTYAQLLGLNDYEQHAICKKVYNEKLTIAEMKKLIALFKQKRYVRLCFFIYLAAVWRIKIKDKRGEVEVCKFLFRNCL